MRGAKRNVAAVALTPERILLTYSLMDCRHVATRKRLLVRPEVCDANLQRHRLTEVVLQTTTRWRRLVHLVCTCEARARPSRGGSGWRRSTPAAPTCCTVAGRIPTAARATHTKKNKQMPHATDAAFPGHDRFASLDLFQPRLQRLRRKSSTALFRSQVMFSVHSINKGATYPCVSVISDIAELVVHSPGSVLQLIEVRLASIQERRHFGSEGLSLSVGLTVGGG